MAQHQLQWYINGRWTNKPLDKHEGAHSGDLSICDRVAVEVNMAKETAIRCSFIEKVTILLPNKDAHD